jgi:tRNA 5-methylaminomethyl-2-thiouridine biosynthesis bifunctional protein
MLGRPTPHGGWLFPQGGWLRPAGACGAMLTACGEPLVRRFGVGSVALERGADGWAVRDGQGAVVAEAPVVILAGGASARGFAQAARLPLASLRGQVTHLAAGSVPALPFVLCREAYLTPAVRGWHSAGATYDDDGETALRPSSQEANLDKLRDMLGDPHAAPMAPLAGRVGFRCAAPDRLPLVGALPDFEATGRIERLRDVPRQPGLYGLLGYGSRGLIWAPLAAELLAAQLEGAPLPVEGELADALDPARFVLRSLLRERRG